MAKKPFIPLEGLNRLTPTELEEYYLAACTFLQVPPELGLLYYRFVDTGDAGAERMLLIKRGACEIIRQRLEISIVSLARVSGAENMISYQAVGKLPSGRQEIAVGNQTTHNQFAKDLANADMAASTKALIRLTLQFSGGGFLWEGEIDSKIATATDTGKPVPAQEKIAATPAPTVAPPLAPGKDITTTTVDAKPVKDQTSEPKVISCAPNIAPEANNDAQDMTPEKPKRKSLRKPKAVVPPASQLQVGDTIELPGGGTTTVAAVGPTPVTPVSPSADIPESQPTATPNKLGLDAPSVEELRAFRSRLAEYSGVHLKKGKMQPLANIGGNHQQLTAYVQKCVPSLTATTQLTKNQWSAVLDKLDAVRENQGVEGLVKHVQEAITGG